MNAFPRADGWDGVELTALLTLESMGDDRFQARFSESNLGGEVFGGQYLGQSLMAALATGGGRAPHAMHGFFLRSARADRPLEFQVERVRDGRSFAHRRVTILQDGGAVFCADVSLHDEEPQALSHQRLAPDVPPPEVLRSLAELLAHYGDALGPTATGRILLKKAVELRPVNSIGGFVEPATEPQTRIWLRPLSLSSTHPQMHYAALAYLSDYWVNAACRLLHVRTLFDGKTTSASLNHSIWFHRVPLVSDWLLYDLDSPSTHGGTGYNRGLIFDRNGRLIASTAQEALIRRLQAPKESST